ncbi:hypothetical protein Tco_1109886 [Tanacetum coccineum]|uniref:Uncharacterized protein n=1 Tax=Tanacetum coccineum TaxID=301880 RepID=A0ABQ5IJN8_9ASTR
MRSLKRPSADLEQPSSKKSKSTEVPKSDVPAGSKQPSVEVPSQKATINDKVSTKKKRLGRKGVHPSHSTIPIEDGDPEAEHKMCIKYASDADSASDDDTPVTLFAVVDWELLPTGLGWINVLYRKDNSRKCFTSLREILHLVTRVDLMTIYGRVMTFYQDKQAKGVGLVLWGNLKVLIDSPEVNDGSEVWKNQNTWNIQSWKLYSYSGVHVLEIVGGFVIHMFVDKKYPLSVNLIERMLDHQLEICQDTVGNELTTACFTSLREILHLVTRADLMTIYGRVMTFYQDKQVAGVGLVLWGDLKVLMDSPEVNDGSDVWKNQNTWSIQSWKLYSYSGVHVLETVTGLVVHMFVDKKYPLSVNLIERMLDHQLEICHDTVGNELTTAVQLIAFLKKQISDSRRPKVHDCSCFDADFLVADSTFMKVAFGVSFKMLLFNPLFKVSQSASFGFVFLLLLIVALAVALSQVSILKLTSEDLSRNLKLTGSNSSLRGGLLEYCIDITTSSTDSARLVPLGKVCTAIETLKKNTAKALISLFTTITLSTTMVVLDSCPKHNMVAYLEKTEGNAEFHEIIDFLTHSSIHHALTVSPVVSTTFVEQFWTSAKSKIINNVRHITAKVAGKPVSISEASIRSDLLFNDANGIDSLPNQAIFDAIQLMGYEGDLTVLTFNKALFSPQWRFFFHIMNHYISSKSTSWDQIPTNIATAVICLTSNQKYNFSKLIFDGMLRHLDAKKKFVMYPRFISIFLDKQLANVLVPLDHFPVNALTSKVFSFMVKKGKHFSRKATPLFSCMLVQPTEDEGAPSERPSEAQPTPSPPHTSELPAEPQPDPSPAHTSEVPMEPQTDPSPRPSPSTIIPDSIPESSGGNLRGHSSSDKSLSGNEGEMTLQSVYDLCLSLCAQVSDQAKEIQHLKAQIKKLKKQAKPVIKHHRAWMQSVSLKQRLARKRSSKKQWVHKESVSKQGRKFAKGEPSVHRDPLFDEIPEDTLDYMETENAQDVGRTRDIVGEEKEE